MLVHGIVYHVFEESEREREREREREVAGGMTGERLRS